MLTEEELKEVYNWIDIIPLSRPKRNISRDFSDCVLAAETVKYFIPEIIELHNYPSVNSTQKKLYNWETFNKRILKKLRIPLRKENMLKIVKCENEEIEKFLLKLKDRLDELIDGPRPKNHKEYDDEIEDVQFERRRVPTQKSNRLKRPKRIKPKGPPVVNSEEERKDDIIEELNETIEILENKVQKMEMLINLKDDKIDRMQRVLQEAGASFQ